MPEVKNEAYWSISPQVTACPDVRIESRKDGDEFLVLACDGVWDVMDNNEVASTVRELVRGDCVTTNPCEGLLDECAYRCLHERSRRRHPDFSLDSSSS